MSLYLVNYILATGLQYINRRIPTEQTNKLNKTLIIYIVSTTPVLNAAAQSIETKRSRCEVARNQTLLKLF